MSTSSEKARSESISEAAEDDNEVEKNDLTNGNAADEGSDVGEEEKEEEDEDEEIGTHFLHFFKAYRNSHFKNEFGYEWTRLCRNS